MDKGKKRFAKQMTKIEQVSKENVREKRGEKSNTLAKIDENSVPCLDGLMMSEGWDIMS